MDIASIGEKGLIERIHAKIHVERDPGLAARDDVFMFGNLVVNADMLVRKTDIPSSMDLYHAGRKAVIMNASDLVVKGIVPGAMVVSLGLPATLPVDGFDQLVEGISLNILRDFSV